MTRSPDSIACPAGVTAVLRAADRMDADRFLRAFALAYITNTSSERRIRNVSKRMVKRSIILEYLDQCGGEGLVYLLEAFEVNLGRKR